MRVETKTVTKMVPTEVVEREVVLTEEEFDCLAGFIMGWGGVPMDVLRGTRGEAAVLPVAEELYQRFFTSAYQLIRNADVELQRPVQDRRLNCTKAAAR
jgi:hypothetical protein